jgi:hypothetical protein
LYLVFPECFTGHFEVGHFEGLTGQPPEEEADEEEDAEEGEVSGGVLC